MLLDLTKPFVRLTITAAIAALGIAAGSGGTVALAGDKIKNHETRIEKLETERDRLIRMETVLERVDKSLQKIEDRLNSPAR